MKKIYLFGNWKMNNGVKETETYMTNLKEIIGANPSLAQNSEICLFPPFISINTAVTMAKDTPIKIGAQNSSQHQNGAYTGEISASMLKDCGCSYTLAGHSERRQMYGETSQLVGQKAQKTLEYGITPVICVGETLEEREAGKTLQIIDAQLQGASEYLSFDDCIIAYEPVWAIGTGRAASAQDAEEVCRHIKTTCGDYIPVLYGGSVKPDNALELFSKPSIDGGLIGGASLKPTEFINILINARK